MKRKLMALMLAGIMVIQSAGTIQATDFTDGQEIEEFSEKTESIPEKDINAFSDIPDNEIFSDSNTFEQNGITANAYEMNMEKFSEGEGTKSNPYVIYDAYQLNNVRNNLNAYYKLGANINLSQFNNWIPIGSIDVPFTGELDGAGFNISGLTIVSSDCLDIGLFGYCSKSAILNNINISDVDINTVLKPSERIRVGTIAGTNLGYTNSCSATGEIDIKIETTSYLEIGGISGRINWVNKCTNRVNISITSNGGVSSGGIAGTREEGNNYISYSSNYGKIKINSYMGEVRSGGISGIYGVIKYCENYGDVECTVTECGGWNSFDYNCNVGGIVGSSSDAIFFSNNYGNIYGKAYRASLCVGGISGLLGYYGNGTMKNCINYGSVIMANKENSYGTAGRIVGVLYTRNIENCYSIDDTLVNNVIPTEHIAHNDINGDSLNNRKKFEISIKEPIILENQNSISVDFEASTPGDVANEEKSITWNSSNPAIAEIDKNTTGLIDGADGNSAFGWINLLTYDVGEVTITGTTQDGRTASVKFNVEPKIDIKNRSINIWSKKSISVCSVTLAKANKNYLQSYLESLKLEITGTSVKIENTTIEISDDGKSAELFGVLQPNTTGETTLTVLSPSGQKETMNVNVTSGKITVQDYDYSKDLDKWMNDQGTANSMAYLSKEENFVNSVMVANYDSSFLDEFIENTTNLVYGGVEGWKNYWNNATKTEQAREILVALLTSYEGKVEELSKVETIDKFSRIYIDTFKNADWAYAVAYGLNSTEINKLAKLCNNEHLSGFFMSGKYEYLSHYLQRVGGYSADSKIIQCIESFSKSKEYAESLSSGIKVMGVGVDILSVTDSTANKYFNLVTLENANEIYCDMLTYLKENCTYEPIKQAATDLYNYK